MLATLGALLLVAAPVKVAVPGFTVVGLEQAVGDAWAEHFVALLGRDGDFQLISSKDIAQVLGLERQRQLLGCSDDQSSCLAELAGALGVDAILTGTFAKAGSTITATLRLLKASDGTQITAATHRAKDLDALQDWLDAQAPELAARMRTAFKLAQPAGAAPVAAVDARAGSSGSSIVRWVPAMVGGAAAITGGVLFGLSKGSATRLRTETLSPDEIQQTGATGRTFEGSGLGLMIGGAAAIAASVVWAVAAPGAPVKAAIVPSGSGAAAVLGGSF